jgi:hypothetical protein
MTEMVLQGGAGMAGEFGSAATLGHAQMSAAADLGVVGESAEDAAELGEIGDTGGTPPGAANTLPEDDLVFQSDGPWIQVELPLRSANEIPNIFRASEITQGTPLAEAAIDGLVDAHPGLDRSNVITGFGNAPEGSYAVEAGPHTAGADVRFVTTDSTSGATSSLEFTVSGLGRNSFEKKLTHAANQQLDGPGTILFQVPEGTSPAQIQELLGRYMGRPERGTVAKAAYYGKINLIFADPQGNIINSGPMVARLMGTTSGDGAPVLSAAAIGRPAGISTASLNDWTGALSLDVPLQIALETGILPAGELGEARIDAVGPDGLPTAGTIVLSADADGVGWYVDLNPLENSAFGNSVGPDSFQAVADSPAAGKYDLFTVLLHEVGHLLGFDPQISGFAAHLGIVAGSELFVGSGSSATLTSEGDDLDPTLYPNDLMSLTLSPGERRLPSPLDLQIIDIVRGIAPPPIGSSAAVSTAVTSTSVASTSILVPNVSAAPPPVSSTTASVVAAIDQVLASTDPSPLTQHAAEKRRAKIEHGKKIVKGPLSHGPVGPRKHPTISIGKVVAHVNKLPNHRKSPI